MNFDCQNLNNLYLSFISLRLRAFALNPEALAQPKSQFLNHVRYNVYVKIS
jgi:hypothetical protein